MSYGSYANWLQNVGYLVIIAPQNFINCTVEFGKSCCGKTVALEQTSLAQSISCSTTVSVISIVCCAGRSDPTLGSADTVACMTTNMIGMTSTLMQYKHLARLEQNSTLTNNPLISQKRTPYSRISTDH